MPGTEHFGNTWSAGKLPLHKLRRAHARLRERDLRNAGKKPLQNCAEKKRGRYSVTMGSFQFHFLYLNLSGSYIQQRLAGRVNDHQINETVINECVRNLLYAFPICGTLNGDCMTCWVPVDRVSRYNTLPSAIGAISCVQSTITPGN